MSYDRDIINALCYALLLLVKEMNILPPPIPSSPPPLPLHAPPPIPATSPPPIPLSPPPPLPSAPPQPLSQNVDLLPVAEILHPPRIHQQFNTVDAHSDIHSHAHEVENQESVAEDVTDKDFLLRLGYQEESVRKALVITSGDKTSALFLLSRSSAGLHGDTHTWLHIIHF